MPNNQKIKFSIYKGSTSMESFILECFNLSKSGLKRFKLSKNFLSKEAKHGASIELDVNIVNVGLIKSYEKSDLLILKETDRLLAISKKYNIHTHPLKYNEIDNALSSLFNKRGQLKFINKSNYDRGLIYRLDYETSGLLLYAKSNDIYNHYRKSYNKLIKKKSYIAVVEGVLNRSIELKNKISSSGKKIKIDEQGIVAHIKVSPIEIKDNKTLIRVELKEGFRHQIRVQLSQASFPILGDTLYGGTKSIRLFLHCYEYQLEDEIFKDENLYLFDRFFNFDGKL